MDINAQYESSLEELVKNRRNVKLVYNALIFARNNQDEELITDFINYIKSDGIKFSTDRLLLFIFDPAYRTEQNYQLIMNSISSFNIDQLNIAFELNRYRKPEHSTREHFSSIYENVLEGLIENGVLNENIFNEKVKLEYLLPRDLGFILSELYEKNKELYASAIAIIRYKSLRVEINSNVNLEAFEKIASLTYCYGIPLKDFARFLNYLKIKLGITEFNLDDLNTCYRIYDYYRKSEDSNIPTAIINKIKMKLPKSLEIDLESLPSKAKVEIGAISQEELKIFIDYFNSINRTDVTITFDFKNIEASPELYNLLKTIKNQENVILTIYKERKRDGSITLADYVKAHNFYEITANTIKEYNFTPLEQYIYVYNLVKSFKQYRRYADNPKKDQKYSELSRNPYIIVGNSYIVCAGFANMATMLLNMLEIKSADLTVTLDDQIYSDNPLHSRIITHLKDEKYGIDGVFIGDPTFDNLGANDFGHMIMLKDEMIDIKKDGNFIAEFRGKVTEIGIDFDVFLNSELSKQVFNQTISPVILMQAFRNVLMKTNPSLTSIEIEQKIKQIFDSSDIKGFLPSVDPNLSLSQYVRENNDFKIDNYFFEYLTNGLSIQQFGSRNGSNSSTIFGVKLKSDKLLPQEIEEMLQNNQSLFTNPYVSYGISELFPSEVAITLTFPQETTIGDMTSIIQELANNLNQIFSFDIGTMKR